MTLVFQFMSMLVSLYGLNTSLPRLPPPPDELLEELDELELDDEPPLLEDEEPPELLDELEELPPGQVVPPGSQPVPQLTVWQW
jgi:hypothetical protein